MSRAWHSDFRELESALLTAARERHARRDVVDGELGWVAYERGVMHDVTNRLRARLGRPPVDAEAIKRAESRACGHIDYTKKFAIGCADLVHADGEGSGS